MIKGAKPVHLLLSICIKYSCKKEISGENKMHRSQINQEFLRGITVAIFLISLLHFSKSDSKLILNEFQFSICSEITSLRTEWWPCLHKTVTILEVQTLRLR